MPEAPKRPFQWRQEREEGRGAKQGTGMTYSHEKELCRQRELYSPIISCANNMGAILSVINHRTGTTILR